MFNRSVKGVGWAGKTPAPLESSRASFGLGQVKLGYVMLWWYKLEQSESQVGNQILKAENCVLAL